MKKTGLYAGTFDPFTYGHADIVDRALRVFDELIIVVANNPSKKTIFTAEERIEILQELYKDEPKVTIDSWHGLIIEYAHTKEVNAIIRGLRPIGDFEYEFQMATLNRKLYGDLDTVFFMTSPKCFYVSSSAVNEIARHGGDVSPFVASFVVEKLKQKFNK